MAVIRSTRRTPKKKTEVVEEPVMRVLPRNCADCVNAIFDEQWGEYKCKAKQCVIYNPEKTCADYKKRQ